MTEEDIKPGDTIRASGIDWDTDGADAAELELPDEVTIRIPTDWEDHETVADKLSDEYGFCINGIKTLERVEVPAA